VDGLITVCDSIATWLANEYHIDRPVVVMNAPTITDDELTAPTRAYPDIRSHLGLAVHVPLVVYVGSVTVDRGLDVCVRALPYLPEVHFATVGPRHEATEREVLGIAIALKVQDRVHLVDAVPSRYVVPFVTTANCSVIPIQNVCLSYYFCFPNKLLESVFARLPVAAANLAELRRFVEEQLVGVIMDETDPRSVAKSIAELLANPDRYRPSLGKIRRLADAFGWGAQEARLLTLYRKLDGKPSTA
jgi:glycosyltransferase involved in cell wall biosynthesis